MSPCLRKFLNIFLPVVCIVYVFTRAVGAERNVVAAYLFVEILWGYITYIPWTRFAALTEITMNRNSLELNIVTVDITGTCAAAACTDTLFYTIASRLFMKT